MTKRRRILPHGSGRFVVPTLAVLLAWMLGRNVAGELESSRLQARYFAEIGAKFRFAVEPGPSPTVRFPHSGPYDKRLGYELMPAFLERLKRRGFSISDQARGSPWLMKSSDAGLFAPYHEKTQAGLQLFDRDGAPLFVARFPDRVYERFDQIPPVVVNTLLFIENRDLLDPDQPTRNPAVDWGRFSHAAFDQLLHVVDSGHSRAGGSTLATQIEKFRHSPEGRTSTPSEKLRQMASATLRAYVDGENTLSSRRQIVVDYLNSVPLLARAGYGEVNGIGDGLAVWYGRDLAEIDRKLATPGGSSGDDLAARALAYKEVLSLLIAQRRPAWYLGAGREDLERTADSYLRLLAGAGVITPALRDSALQQKLAPMATPVEKPRTFVASRKAAALMREELADALGVPRLYDLDRLDLSAVTSIDARVQAGVEHVLRQLREPAAARELGLVGYHMFGGGDDSGDVVYSVTVYERRPGANLLRVQTDSITEPFDVNAGARMDLGSTAKLRTLVTYLQIVVDLRERYGAMTAEQLQAVKPEKNDVLTRWAVDYLAKTGDHTLRPMLEAAMARRYSANPGEEFYTGGGRQVFHNFEPEDNGRVMTVRQAFQRSVNLVFVRLMRDVERYYLTQAVPDSEQLLEDGSDPRRVIYLAQFAAAEGKTFLADFYSDYRGLGSPEAIEEHFLDRVRPQPRRLAAAWRGLHPEADLAAFSAFMTDRLPADKLSEAKLQRLYEESAPDRLDLNDRGFVAGIHPLELWLAGYLSRRPGATLAQVMSDSGAERQMAYSWLYKTRNKAAQDRRIRDLLEQAAFARIGQSWRRLGYPFAALTPSYATAIGASGDRPAALAELMGIIASRGVRQPTVRIEALRFASGTPFETRLVDLPAKPERLRPAEVADVVRAALTDVVEGGTASRIRNAFHRSDGTVIPVAGKTGTGEQRFSIFGRGGGLVSSRVLNRSATFVFMIGDRFFGTVTAYAPEPRASEYHFTSALSVQLLKSLEPALQPLLDEPVGAIRVAAR